MKKSGLLLMFMIGCGGNYVSPSEQTFEDLDSWGNGIDGFDPSSSTPLDTSVGSSEYDGLYLGNYELFVYLDSGTDCYCTESIAINIEEGDIRVGTATQCTMDCSYVAALKFDGTVLSDGTVSGPVIDEAAFGFGAPWSGLFTLDGRGEGSFNEIVDTNLGSATINGLFLVQLQSQ